MLQVEIEPRNSFTLLILEALCFSVFLHFLVASEEALLGIVVQLFYSFSLFPPYEASSKACQCWSLHTAFCTLSSAV